MRNARVGDFVPVLGSHVLLCDVMLAAFQLAGFAQKRILFIIDMNIYSTI